MYLGETTQAKKEEHEKTVPDLNTRRLNKVEPPLAVSKQQSSTMIEASPSGTRLTNQTRTSEFQKQ